MTTTPTYRVFLSCRFPLSEIAQLCREVGSAVHLDVATAERPALEEITEKVKQSMFGADAVLFLIERSNGSVADDVMTNWMKIEYGMARTMNKVVGIVVANSQDLPSGFASDVEYLSLGDVAGINCAVRLSAFLFSMREKVEAVHPDLRDIQEPTFVRDFVKHRINLLHNGRATYQTHVGIECLKEGLSDLRHSIHMNYSLCWPHDQHFNPNLVQLTGLGGNHEFSIEAVASDMKKYTFRLNIEPPLRRGERIRYGWESEFQHYLPMRREEIKLLPSYPLPEWTVEHHWFVNHPTRSLELRVHFEDGSVIGDPEAMAYVGRTFSTRTVDRDEGRRIREHLDVDEFIGGKDVVLVVEKPRHGHTYAIQWELTR